MAQRIRYLRDEIHGQWDPDEGPWDQDATGFNWRAIIQQAEGHAESFQRELKRLTELIGGFARSAGVAITDVHHLTQGVRAVIEEYAEHRERRAFDGARASALPPGKK